jgi:hypothetical protein
LDEGGTKYVAITLGNISGNSVIKDKENTEFKILELKIPFSKQPLLVWPCPLLQHH